MTKNETQNLEALKIAFQLNEWEDFLLVLNEIRDRDKETISMYRDRIFRFKDGCKNAVNELQLLNGNKEIAISELNKVLN